MQYKIASEFAEKNRKIRKSKEDIAGKRSWIWLNIGIKKRNRIVHYCSSRPRIKDLLDQICNSKIMYHQNAGFVFQKMNQQ